MFCWNPEKEIVLITRTEKKPQRVYELLPHHIKQGLHITIRRVWLLGQRCLGAIGGNDTGKLQKDFYASNKDF